MFYNVLYVEFASQTVLITFFIHTPIYPDIDDTDVIDWKF